MNAEWGDPYIDLMDVMSDYESIENRDSLDSDSLEYEWLGIYDEVVGQLWSSIEHVYRNSGGSMVLDSEWSAYCEEFVSDVGGVSDKDWIYSYVDWDDVEDSLKADTTEISAGRYTYYLRG